MNSSTEIYAFIKFTETPYVESILDQGLLYMNNLKYYQGHAKQGLLGDLDEGLHRSLAAEDYDVYIAGEKMDGVIGRIRISSGQERNTFLFCMTQLNNAIIDPSATEFTPDSRFKEFGDQAIIIPGKNWPQFLALLNERLAFLYESKRITYYQGEMVSYVPKNHKDFLGPLRKFDTYEWQQEWRLIVQTKEPAEAFTELKIGNMRNLVMTYSTEELMQKKFQVKPRHK